MSLQSAADVPLLISSPNSSSERRISPSWSIAHLKSRLEPITGVPAHSQQLSLRIGSQDAVPITGLDEEQTRLAEFSLQPYAELIVSDLFLLFLVSALLALHPRLKRCIITGLFPPATFSKSWSNRTHVLSVYGSRGFLRVPFVA